MSNSRSNQRWCKAQCSRFPTRGRMHRARPSIAAVSWDLGDTLRAQQDTVPAADDGAR